MTAQAAEPFAGAGALIFGGAKGIGKAVATEWARRGARLAIADIDEFAARQTAQEICERGGTAHGIAADVLSDQSVAEAAQAARDALGEVDILMCNVGAILNGHPEDIPFAETRRIMDLNFLGTMRATEQFLPGFIERGRGHIVTTASFAGMFPYAVSRIPYAAAKAAVISLSQNLALYCEPLGVRVSCLVPGPVLTGVMDSMTSWTADIPVRGPGTETTLMLPEAVAATLSDGMAAGRMLIPSDDVAFDILKRWADGPDDYVRDKIARFASGDEGRPSIPAEMLAMLKAT